MQVLVDSSIWIDYFRSGDQSSDLDDLIDENLIVINDIIFAELVPFLQIKNQTKIIRLLGAIKKLPLLIEWEQIIQFQVDCLRAGMHGVGITDLLIAQNAKQNQCQLYSLDKHFRVLNQMGIIHLF